jgi:hypothetical protein
MSRRRLAASEQTRLTVSACFRLVRERRRTPLRVSAGSVWSVEFEPGGGGRLAPETGLEARIEAPGLLAPAFTALASGAYRPAAGERAGAHVCGVDVGPDAFAPLAAA